MTDLPTGTVTFLFTDIEGSTSLAQSHPAEWESARQRHHAILHAAIATHQGYVFQIIGDAFCVAFHNASNAITASVSAQRALQVEAWDTTPLRVRMGLHTGATEFHDGDYRGYLTLAQVQRVMSVAYGGQILVSNATAGLLAGQLPAGVSLRDMGEHRLKGLLNPEHLWQVVAMGLVQDFPPLQSLNTIPNNLPIQVTSFVGREREVTELERLLPTTRLLTLTGSGGTGKTRLSLQVAAAVLDSFKDGAWLVELAPLSDPALMLSTIASVLGVREDPGRSLLATLLDWLRPKQLLLILDNCEHLIEACAKFADAVLHASRETRILASSREALGIAGELAWRVPSLEIPNPTVPASIPQLEKYAAVQLFIERAKFAHAAFTLTVANAPSIAQICYRLDGIPLAIELAATRVKALPVEKIAERLDDRFRLLTGGSRTALPRQQTLRSLVDWSHSLLTEPERILLRRLSVFAGGWSLEAAEAVCAGDGLEPFDVLDLLTRLVDKSLVVLEERASDAHYRLLETIRQYAREKLLDAAESEPWRDRHLAFFLTLAEHAEPMLNMGQFAPWLTRLDWELDNLRAALEWSCAHHPETARRLSGLLRSFWVFADHLNEGQACYKRVLALSGRTARSEGVAIALLGAGLVSEYILPGSEDRALLEEAVVRLQELGDSPRLAEALYNLAYVMMHLGHAEEACVILESNDALIRQFAEPSILAYALTYRGRALSAARGDYAAAKTLHLESLAVARHWKDPEALGTTTMNLGLLALQEGDYEAASAYQLESLAWRRQLGSRWDIAIALVNVADVACLHGEYQQAQPLYAESLTLCRAIGVQGIAAYALAGLGYLAVQQGDLARAAGHLAESMEIYRQREQQQLPVARCLVGYAELRRAQGRVELAARLLAAIGQFAAFRDVLLPAQNIKYQRSVAAARSQLDEAAFNAAWEAGSQMTLEQAVVSALRESDP